MHLSSVIRRLRITCTAGEQLAPEVSTAGRRDHWKAKIGKMPVFRIVRYRAPARTEQLPYESDENHPTTDPSYLVLASHLSGKEGKTTKTDQEKTKQIIPFCVPASTLEHLHPLHDFPS